MCRNNIPVVYNIWNWFIHRTEINSREGSRTHQILQSVSVLTLNINISSTTNPHQKPKERANFLAYKNTVRIFRSAGFGIPV